MFIDLDLNFLKIKIGKDPSQDRILEIAEILTSAAISILNDLALENDGFLDVKNLFKNKKDKIN